MEVSRPLVGVGLCICRVNRVLLHKRKGKHAPGLWGFPGGHLEMYEDFEGSALRELQEEAGPMVVTRPQLWTVSNTIFLEESKHYVVVFMVANWLRGEAIVVEPEKNDGWEWFDWNDLPAAHLLMPGIVDLKRRGEKPFNSSQFKEEKWS
jgi:8-oxo-dGTP diphosphatase